MIELLNGDCLELLPSIADSSIDMVCADMPYGTTNCKWDAAIDLNALWPELIRITKDSAPIVLFAQTPFDKVLGASNLPMLRYEWIWEKTNATGFLNAKKMPMKAHENILVFYKKLPTYNPQKTKGHKRASAGRKPVNSEVYGKAIHKTYYDSTERYPRSVLTFPHDKQRKPLHPTQKPQALIKYLLETYSNQGDLILDFCFGSGTTAAACIETGRHFIGMEKESGYYEIALQRTGLNKGEAA